MQVTKNPASGRLKPSAGLGAEAESKKIPFAAAHSEARLATNAALSWTNGWPKGANGAATGFFVLWEAMNS
ncbi:MAG: hypothetical protein Fur007_03140 [Rhodoferax sp.]